MKYIATGILIIFSFSVISQENENKTFKNDITLFYGAELNHFNEKTPGIEYRRSLNDNWKLKISLMGDRHFTDTKSMTSHEFALSDTANIYRTQDLNYGIERSIKIGIDYTQLQHFSFGAQFILGNANATSLITDRAYYDTMDESGFGSSAYSDELTQEYHPNEPSTNPSPNGSSRAVNVGSWKGYVANIDYIGMGLGLSIEAKWPFERYFEAALQYNPEFIYYKMTEFTTNYDLDSHYSVDFPDFGKFYQFAHLLVRYKF